MAYADYGFEHEDRDVSTGLLVGIVVLPIIFAWFTLKGGYSSRSRIFAFLWLSVHLIIPAVFATAAVKQGLAMALGGL